MLATSAQTDVILVRTEHDRINRYLTCSKHERRRISKLSSLASSSPLILAVIIIALNCTTTSILSTTMAFHVDQRCQPTGSFVCNIDNYNTVQPFNNTLGHTTLELARSSLHKYAFLMKIPECEKRVQLFLCSLYFPVCVSPPDVTTKPLLPCRNICEDAYHCEPHIRSAMNTTWPSEWDCNNFKYYGDDHKLCVIDNQKESGSDQPRPPPVMLLTDGNQLTNVGMSTNLLPAIAPSITTGISSPDEISICDQGFFDCRLSDPKRPLCIEMKYVCDGKRDCYRNDSLYEQNAGLDEMDCKERCEEGQLHCDDKCISRYDICNGRVDCSSGVDEQDCIDGLTGIIQSILLVFVMSSVVYILVRSLRAERGVDDKEQPSYESPYDIHREASLPTSQTDVLKDALISPEPYRQLPPTPLSHQPPMTQSSPSCLDSTYQAPSILTRSDAYDTARIGGDSGACSVYAYGPLGNPRRAFTPPPAPPAPPSTPLPVHSDSPEILDFLDPTDFPGYFVTGYTDSHIYVNGYEGNRTSNYGNQQQAFMTSRTAGSFHTNRQDIGCSASATLPHGHQAHRMVHDWNDGGRSSGSPAGHSSGYHRVVDNKSRVPRADTRVART